MIQQSYQVLGVMSGTSLDGIDLALCKLELDANQRWHFEIHKGITVPYDVSWQKTLKEAVHYSASRLKTLNEEYTKNLGSIIYDFLTKTQADVDFICSHGHTILHEPQKGVTLQIGNLPMLASYTGKQVVCDFRVQDVQMGGQGAPLVPIGDRLLFGGYDACVNLGGFANISFEEKGERIAYDICPVNIVLNDLANRFGLEYDKGGLIAQEGTVNLSLLSSLNDLEYYKEKPPKSLGLEWVQREITPLLKNAHCSDKDLISTFTQHIAVKIIENVPQKGSVLFTGGGVYNSYLMRLIAESSKSLVVIPDPQVLEFKEALVFALLGVLKVRGEVNCLASVTGASADHSSGVVFLP